jgi:hypothetical protein
MYAVLLSVYVWSTRRHLIGFGKFRGFTLVLRLFDESFYPTFDPIPRFYLGHAEGRELDQRVTLDVDVIF